MNLTLVPAATPARADLLVEFNFEELQNAIERDLFLTSELKLKDTDAVLERALMYLHEQHVIKLQKGLAVFRSAMTIRMQPEAKGEKYKARDYQPLEHHYQERVLQVGRVCPAGVGAHAGSPGLGVGLLHLG
jgi:ATP-dependent DNA helicase RecQ